MGHYEILPKGAAVHEMVVSVVNAGRPEWRVWRFHFDVPAFAFVLQLSQRSCLS
jgi:hypothetical protein